MSYNGYNWPCESYNANGQPRQQLYEGQQHPNSDEMQADLFYQRGNRVVHQPVRDWVNAYLTSAEAAPKSDWVNEYLTPARTPLPEVGQPARKEVQQGYFREHDREVQNPKESEWVNGNLPPTKVPLLGSIEANCEGAQQEPYFIAKQRNHHGPDQRE
ncbi:hypothetical protein Y032_0002g709 [Ancylostoma ceylanicum]|uniref:Uncharacterized protein n=1 Tax=Ancylostoma ceylanicum TaxID=53326 RepID=A0A016W0X4_9BILA|nr:hypothetical protein Y032_0002g709 [Ancylostoma ceylanicum]